MNNGMNKDKSILVVDDNAFVLESTAELIEARGYNVVACSDAKEAIQSAPCMKSSSPCSPRRTDARALGHRAPGQAP